MPPKKTSKSSKTIKKSKGKTVRKNSRKNSRKTTVVNIHKKDLNEAGYHDFKAWAKVPNHMYIGRNMNFYVPGTYQSKWANPYPLSKYTRSQSMKLYEKYIRESDLYNHLGELKGKVLGCWCKPLLCHGDILIKLMKEKKKKT
jgi:hypothetical protein